MFFFKEVILYVLKKSLYYFFNEAKHNFLHKKSPSNPLLKERKAFFKKSTHTVLCNVVHLAIKLQSKLSKFLHVCPSSSCKVIFLVVREIRNNKDDMSFCLACSKSVLSLLAESFYQYQVRTEIGCISQTAILFLQIDFTKKFADGHI